ncbi:MAG: prephenate dehydrogenase, partial [Clostridia bacterium]|nr:prephenate dehydrogenase [Clostridia bacterium]
MSGSSFDKSCKIVIIGLGVIGGSYAMALTQAGCNNVFGVDLSCESVEKAVQMGIISDGGVFAERFVKDADIVVLAVYPCAALQCVKDIAPHLKDGAVVTDVFGIKSGLIEEISSALPKCVSYVPAHPMAGREKRGIDYASAQVFSGANFIITPLENSQQYAVEI